MNKFKRFILIIIGILKYKITFLRIRQWEKIHGSFDKKNYRKYNIYNLPNESTFYFGEIVKWISDITPSPGKALFAGESTTSVNIIRDKIGLGETFAAGLGESDFTWNFENDPPDNRTYDLVVSQAILEHLLDPCKHFRDLVSLTSPGGYLLVHTVTPDFPYHRYPIDAFRFYPDWFSEMAGKTGLKIIRQRIKKYHIFYLFQKI